MQDTLLCSFRDIENHPTPRDRLLMQNFCKEMFLIKDYFLKIKRNPQQVCVFNKLDKFFLKAQKFEKSVKNKEIVKKVKKIFREEMRPVLYQSRLIKHSSEKARGYPGDYKIIESIYENKAVSKTAFGIILDNYLLRNFYAEAIRQRKDKTRDFLELLIGKNSKKKLNILNLACGSCREIREILEKNPALFKGVKFFLVDKDAEAIQYAKRKLSHYEKLCSFAFTSSDVIAFLKKNIGREKARSRFDFIYSIGLADYLPNVIFEMLIRYSIINLKVGGQFLTAHKNTKLYASPISDWATDWKFIPRDYQEVVDLIQESNNEEINIEILNGKRDPVVFFLVTKLKDR